MSEEDSPVAELVRLLTHAGWKYSYKASQFLNKELGLCFASGMETDDVEIFSVRLKFSLLDEIRSLAKETTFSDMRADRLSEEDFKQDLLNEANRIGKEKQKILRSRIVSTPDTCAGDPRINNTRITVRNVKDMLLYMTPAEILSDFPQLTREDIEAARDYQEPKGDR